MIRFINLCSTEKKKIEELPAQGCLPKQRFIKKLPKNRKLFQLYNKLFTYCSVSNSQISYKINYSILYPLNHPCLVVSKKKDKVSCLKVFSFCCCPSSATPKQFFTDSNAKSIYILLIHVEKILKVNLCQSLHNRGSLF